MSTDPSGYTNPSSLPSQPPQYPPTENYTGAEFTGNNIYEGTNRPAAIIPQQWPTTNTEESTNPINPGRPTGENGGTNPLPPPPLGVTETKSGVATEGMQHIDGAPECVMVNMSGLKAPEDTSLQMDANQYCYQEYCRLYYANIILTNQLKVLLTEKNELQANLNALDTSKVAGRIEGASTHGQIHTPFEIDEEGRKKRHRRTAGEISRHYRCPIEICGKSYGSEGSLNQHVKIKHPEYMHSLLRRSGIADQPGSEGLPDGSRSIDEDDEHISDGDDEPMGDDQGGEILHEGPQKGDVDSEHEGDKEIDNVHAEEATPQ